LTNAREAVAFGHDIARVHAARGDLGLSATHFARRTDRFSAGRCAAFLGATMHTHPDLIITDTDLQRLRPLLDQHDTPASESLDAELHRATIVPQHEVPSDVVTMDREVVYEDCATGVRRTVRIVYPQDADAGRGFVSVLAPMGSALLGLRVGQTIEWRVPTGIKRVRVVEVRVH
jgi:regulator of nucleoside diphosphate kinase